MIAWMNEEANKAVEEAGVAVYGFANEDVADAWMTVEQGDDCYKLHLGDIRDISLEELNKRFLDTFAELPLVA